MDFSYVHIRYFIGYVYHICLQDTIQSTLSLCLLCQAMLLPMPLRPLLLTTRSGFNTNNNQQKQTNSGAHEHHKTASVKSAKEQKSNINIQVKLRV